MNTYSKQISDINNIAKHFAISGYHVITSFFSLDGGCEVTVFFYDIQLKESIYNYLRKYKDDNDSLTFDAFPQENNTHKFYIYKLQKQPS